MVLLIGVELRQCRMEERQCRIRLQWAACHQVAIEVNDLWWRAVCDNLVIINAEDSVEIAEKVQVMTDADELLLQGGRILGEYGPGYAGPIMWSAHRR